MDIDPRQQAADLIANFNKNAAAIRANKQLSDVGKASQILPLYDETKARLNEIRQAKDNEAAATLIRLQKKLFALPASGSSADIMSLRDAQDRVADLDTQDDAIDLLDRATLNEDTTLGKAVLQRAFNKWWTKVIQAYADVNPSQLDDIQQLVNITRTGTADPAKAMLDGLHYTLIPPAEDTPAMRRAIKEQTDEPARQNKQPYTIFGTA